MKERVEMDVASAAREIRSRVLTIHGTADKTIPHEDAEAFDRYIDLHELCLLEGADHNFTQEVHLQALAEKTAFFFN